MPKAIRKYIPENSTEMQEKFINCLMHQGKKSIARRIWKDTLIEISEKGNKDPEIIFEKAIEQTKPAMEVRPRRVGGAVYQVPVEVKPHRQLSLSFRWLLLSARGMKGSPMYKRLATTLIEASNGQGPAVKKKDDVHRMAQANKAFAHLAKY
ncbi:MAG: 30S ribosomal protein S7 [Patescibacteria group bacterium]